MDSPSALSVPALDEESRTLLRSIVEKQAWRQLMAINMMGHCLKYIPEIATKLALAEDLDTSLRLFRELQTLYRELGWEDLESAVRDKMDRIPFPATRLEYGIGRHLCDLAEATAMRAYVDSSSKALGAIALSCLESTHSVDQIELERFVEYCSDERNRSHAQQMVQRWLGIALRSFGRPGTRGDARAVALGLRTKPNAQMARDYLEQVKTLLARCGLALPTREQLGVELP